MRTTKFWSSTSITSSRYAKRCQRRESVASTCAHGTKRRHRTVVRSRIPTSQRRSKRSCGRSMQHSIPCASSRNLRSSRRNYSLFKNSTETGNSNLLTVPLLNELQRLAAQTYFLVSLCFVCARHHLQYLGNSILRVTSLRFLRDQ